MIFLAKTLGEKHIEQEKNSYHWAYRRND